MKKYWHFFLGLWLSTAFISKANAFCDPLYEDCSPMFGGPQVDYLWDVSSALKAVSTGDLLGAMRNQLMSTLNVQDMITHAGMKGMGLVGTTINKGLDKIAGKKVTSASRIIEEPKDVDLENEQQVQQAFEERFLQYPGKKNKNNLEYEKMGEQLKIDTTLEMYIIAREMEKEIEQKLAQLEKIESCILEGDSEACDAAGFDQNENCEKSKEQEDELCLQRANLMIARLYDQIMWYNEFLTAMQAQYQAVMSIGTRVKIKEYQEPEKDAYAVPLMQHKQNYAKNTIWSDFSFADVEWFEGTPAEPEVKQKNGFDVVERAAGYTGSLAGKQATFESLKPLSEAQKAVQMAIRAHNVKSQLESFQQVYEMFHLFEEYRAKVREHWNMSDECVRNYLGQYYQNTFQAWMGKECGVYEDKVYCPYLTEDMTGLGLFDIDCPNNSAQRCYVSEAVDVAERSGLSGYLQALYEESKTQAATGEIKLYLNEDNDEDSEKIYEKYVITREDSSRQARQERLNSPLTSINKINPQNEKGFELKNPNNQEKMIDEMRTAGKLNWMNGSLVSRAMVSDINSKQGGKFGMVKQRYPLWNDQKEFYDQYIRGKYANMKEYIATAPLSALVIGAARAANKLMDYPIKTDSETGQKTDERNNEAVAIEQLEGQISLLTDGDEVENLIAEEKKVLSEIKEKYENTRKKIKQKIVAEGEQIEELNTRLDSDNRAYNQQDEIMDSAEMTTSQSEDGIRLENDMYAQRKKEDEKENVKDIKSPFAENFEQRIHENDEAWTEASIKKEELQDNTEAVEAEINQRKENIERLKKEMNLAVKSYVKEYSDTLREYNQKINEAAESKHNSGAYALLQNAAQKFIAVDMAQNVAMCVRQKVIDKIEKAEEKLQKMQESSEIYYAENTDKIQKIHNDMIKEILDMGKDADAELTGCGNGLADEILAEISVGAFVDLLLDMCADDYCITPEPNDENGAVYFVGKTAKPRDFRTPTGPLNFASAPLREIFYFDEQDYENVEKYYVGDEEPNDNHKITIVGESFLNSGAEMPEVWKYILKVRPFVEQEIDLDELLNRGNPDLAFSRAGIFPCRLDGQNVDAAFRDNDIPYIFGYKLNVPQENVIVQKCRLLANKGGKLINTETDYAEKITDKIGTAVNKKDVSQTSELGQILAYVPEYVSKIQQMFSVAEPPRKLSFNQAFLSALHSQDNMKDDESDRAVEQFKYGMRALFVHNQFGDYLDFMEMDKKAEQMLAEQKAQMEKIHQKLQEIFNEFGDTISDDFDLADENDYDMAEMKLDSYKNAYMRNALEKLLQVLQAETVSSVHEKADNVQKQIELLSLDEDAIVEITGSEDKAELEYKIKQQTANREIVGAYHEKAVEDMKKQIRQLQKPYCAVYAK